MFGSGIVWGLQKCRNITKNPIYLSWLSVIGILHSMVHFFTVDKSTLMHSYSLKPTVHPDVLHCNLMFCFCPMIPPKAAQDSWSSCLLRALLLWQFLRLRFDNLDNFEEYWPDIFWNVPLVGFVWYFLMITLELGFFGRKAREVKSHPYHIISWEHTISTTYHYEPRPWSPAWGSSQVSLSES